MTSLSKSLHRLLPSIVFPALDCTSKVLLVSCSTVNQIYNMKLAPANVDTVTIIYCAANTDQSVVWWYYESEYAITTQTQVLAAHIHNLYVLN